MNRPAPSGWLRIRRACSACIVILAGACTPDPAPAVGASRGNVPFDSLETGIVGGRGSYAEEAEAIPGFGGTYYEQPCTRIVLLTDPTPANVAAARAFYGAKAPGCENERLTIESARYEWRRLQEWYFDRLRIADLPGLTTAGINVIRNRVVIGVVDRDARDRVERRLGELAIPRAAVIVGITGPRAVPEDLEFRVGVLNDADHRHVAGVRVEVYRGGDCLRSAVTDTTGTVRIDSLRPGVYTVRIVSPAGYRPAPGQGESADLRLTGELLTDVWLRFRLKRAPGAPAGTPTRRCTGSRPA